ncbi:NAD(P)-dependent malic enzyme [Thermoanaerobacterium thermosaccharolyticum]|uniref:NAD(P)-dependent malic enzyme n=1 Tax=Thermoanaerobacterium thermosaccharolyticum TaxID=1517 RepID=UPI0017841C21|nr:malic enzyme-like NAD(P)-binding protein [Thermoanaerobacterium thermosaccharolyticum]MBE0069467.1 NAD-dependent malic enzyme [Thermoanaerobacterium thermosaccharolyticum]MBE0229147.1 NAD-dependent malic enzyme [Thermoanaerobacterium thermosaccharolyticum]MCP2240175.1 malate dehydrogenase (oxaloacetate-decarboxylating) [Thermoanaerobacterium thermosaccharolyticum]
MDLREEALKLHKDNHGKISILSKVPVNDSKDLSLAYTPGVAEPCKEIHKNPDMIYDYTNKGNFVAVVTDGSAVLGLGDIGAMAGMPVMEGKAVLFKEFGGIDAFPICIGTKDVDKIVETVINISPTFGGINLEDISAPRCFEIEERLKKALKIPVFHDDQHGTAVVVFAGLINALKIVNKNLKSIKAVINGAGAAGIAIAKLLISAGIGDVILCDRKGIIYEERQDTDSSKISIAKITNKDKLKGTLKDALIGADVFIGVSAPNIVTKDMVKAMNNDAIVFALANPVPEIYPDVAKEGGARVIGTGRSDFPNQINNVLAFPGIFRGALEVRATEINEEMKIQAAYAIASLVSDEELKEDYIIPKAFDKRVAKTVAANVAKAAMDTKVANLNVDLVELEKKLNKIL